MRKEILNSHILEAIEVHLYNPEYKLSEEAISSLTDNISDSIMDILIQASNNVHCQSKFGPKGSEETPFTSLRNKLTPFWILSELVLLEEDKRIKDKLPNDTAEELNKITVDSAHVANQTKPILLEIISELEKNSIKLE